MAVGAAVVGILGTAYSTYSMNRAASSQKKAARQAKRAGEIKARDERLRGLEEKRKMKKELAYKEGLARARAGASGISLGGTVAQYLADLKEEGLKDLAWLTEVSESRVQTALAGGELSATQSRAGAATSTASAWQGVGQLATQSYSAYKSYGE